MRLQDSAAGCGPASMSNALAALGIVRAQPECEALCKTTGTAGTSPKKLYQALQTIDEIQPGMLVEARADVAMLRLEGALRRGRPVILCVDGYEHWVAAIGVLGDRVLVADSADTDLVLSLSPGEVLARWEGGGRFKFYGVVL